MDKLFSAQAFYFWGAFSLLPFWLLIFRKKDHRKEMLLMGSFIGILGVIIGKCYATLDYWHPPYLLGRAFNFEDFLYAFLYSGIAAELLEYVKGESGQHHPKYIRQHFLFPLFGLIVLLSFFFLVDFLGLNSIVAHIAPLIVIGAYVGLERKDLLKPSLASGFLLTFLTLVWYKLIILALFPSAIKNYWVLENLSGILILGVPVEEFIFAFAVGFGVSNTYELIFGEK